ncbi:hypothetical protein GQ457_15G030060 [Hibiscus cannabinus]
MCQPLNTYGTLIDEALLKNSNSGIRLKSSHIREIGMKQRITFSPDQAGNSARLTFLASARVERDDRGPRSSASKTLPRWVKIHDWISLEWEYGDRSFGGHEVPHTEECCGDEGPWKPIVEAWDAGGVGGCGSPKA